MKRKRWFNQRRCSRFFICKYVIRLRIEFVCFRAFSSLQFVSLFSVWVGDEKMISQCHQPKSECLSNMCACEPMCSENNKYNVMKYRGIIQVPEGK